MWGPCSLEARLENDCLSALKEVLYTICLIGIAYLPLLIGINFLFTVLMRKLVVSEMKLDLRW